MCIVIGLAWDLPKDPMISHVRREESFSFFFSKTKKKKTENDDDSKNIQTKSQGE